MPYRVSLTGDHSRFSVPQLGYLGYHCLTLINLIGISATDLRAEPDFPVLTSMTVTAAPYA
jgi:hypothetical protein